MNLGYTRKLKGMGLEYGGAPNLVRQSSLQAAVAATQQRQEISRRAAMLARPRPIPSPQRATLQQAAQRTPEGRMYATAQAAIPLREHTKPDWEPLVLRERGMGGVVDAPIPIQKLIADLPPLLLRALGFALVTWMMSKQLTGPQKEKWGKAALFGLAGAYSPVFASLATAAYVTYQRQKGK